MLESTVHDPQSKTESAAIPPLPQRDRTRQIRDEQIRSVYNQSPTTTIGSLVVALVVVAIMWSDVPKPILIGWFLAMCAHQGVRIYHYLTFRKLPPDRRPGAKWGRLYTIAAFTAGCIWGSAGVLMFVPGSVTNQAVLLLLLSSVVTVSMISLAAFAPAFFSLAPLTLSPYIIRMLFERNDAHLYFAVVGVLVLVMALVFGRAVNRMIAESLAKRFDNLDLVEQLTAQTKLLAEQKAVAERAQHDAELANSAKSQFFRAANHDLRQPLHALGMFGRALSERIRYPEVRTIVEGMNASIRSLEGLFNELLDLSKLDAGVIEPEPRHFPLRTLFDRLERDFLPEVHGKQLRLRIVPTTVAVYTDPVLLERILRNLVSNAIRYTRKGEILVGCRRHAEHVRIEVWDTGVGIPQHEQERVFEEFYQAGNPDRHSKKGLGLGLATVRRLAHLLNHKLDLASQPGRGSVFSIEVPIGREEKATPAAPPPAGAAANDGFAGKVIIVVDDEEVILHAMQAMLSGWGCEVLARSSTEDVLEALGELSRYPDLIIADYRLQERKTGIEAIERIRSELGQPVPAIIITGSTTEAIAEAEAGGYLLLHKPVLPEALQQVMGAALERPRI